MLQQIDPHYEAGDQRHYMCSKGLDLVSENIEFAHHICLGNLEELATHLLDFSNEGRFSFTRVNRVKESGTIASTRARASSHRGTYPSWKGIGKD